MNNNYNQDNNLNGSYTPQNPEHNQNPEHSNSQPQNNYYQMPTNTGRPYEQYQQQNSYNNTYNSQIPYIQPPVEPPLPPVSVLDWILSTFVALFVPCVNFVVLIVWAVSKKTNPNKQNWARAMLIINALIYAIAFVQAF